MSITLHHVRHLFAQAVHLLHKSATNEVVAVENGDNRQTTLASWIYIQTKTLLSNSSATYLPSPSETPDLKIQGHLPYSPPSGWIPPAKFRLKEEEILASNHILEEEGSLADSSSWFTQETLNKSDSSRPSDKPSQPNPSNSPSKLHDRLSKTKRRRSRRIRKSGLIVDETVLDDVPRNPMEERLTRSSDPSLKARVYQNLRDLNPRRTSIPSSTDSPNTSVTLAPNPRRSSRLSGVQTPPLSLKDKSDRVEKRSISPVDTRSNNHKRPKLSSSPDKNKDASLLADPHIPGLPWRHLTSTMRERAIGYLKRNIIHRQSVTCQRCIQQTVSRERIEEDCITMFDAQGGSIACFRCGYRQLTCTFANGSLIPDTPVELEPSNSSSADSNAASSESSPTSSHGTAQTTTAASSGFDSAVVVTNQNDDAATAAAVVVGSDAVEQVVPQQPAVVIEGEREGEEEEEEDWPDPPAHWDKKERVVWARAKYAMEHFGEYPFEYPPELRRGAGGTPESDYTEEPNLRSKEDMYRRIEEILVQVAELEENEKDVSDHTVSQRRKSPERDTAGEQPLELPSGAIDPPELNHHDGDDDDVVVVDVEGDDTIQLPNFNDDEEIPPVIEADEILPVLASLSVSDELEGGTLASVLRENPVPRSLHRRTATLRTYSRNDRTTMPMSLKTGGDQGLGDDYPYTLRPAFSADGSTFPDLEDEDVEEDSDDHVRKQEKEKLRSCSQRELPHRSGVEQTHESVHHFRALLHTHQSIIQMRQNLFSLLHANDTALRHSRQSLLNATTQLKQYPFPWDIPSDPPFDGLEKLADDLVCAWSNGFDEKEAFEGIRNYDRAKMEVDRHAVDPIEEELDVYYYPNVAKVWSNGVKGTIE